MENNKNEFQISCNILLIGKIGTGKSSFANYLFGTDKFTTGKGKPVTGWEENFQHYHFIQDGITVNVYDTVGLEADNQSEWNEKLDTFLSERQTAANNTMAYAMNLYAMNLIVLGIIATKKFSSRAVAMEAEKLRSEMAAKTKTVSPNEIIHSCFYFVNAASARCPQGEIAFIKKLSDKYNLPITVVLTHSDAAKEEQLEAIAALTSKEGIESIRVCSVRQEPTWANENGSEPFGRELAVKKMLKDSYIKVGLDLSLILIDGIIQKLQSTCQRIIENIGFFNSLDMKKLSPNDLIDKVVGSEQNILKSYQNFDKVFKGYDQYRNFLNSFNMQYAGKNLFEETYAEISNIMQNAQNEKSGERSFTDKLFSEFPFIIIGPIPGLIKGLVDKNRAKNEIQGKFDTIVDKLAAQKEKLLKQRRDFGNTSEYKAIALPSFF